MDKNGRCEQNRHRVQSANSWLLNRNFQRSLSDVGGILMGVCGDGGQRGMKRDLAKDCLPTWPRKLVLKGSTED
jgi:hypothetical protein